MHTDFDFTKIYLMVGQACNFSCRHCVEHDHKVSLKKHVSDKLVTYLQHLADIRPRNAHRFKSTIDVLFFGGEPLLYLPTLREVMDRVDRENVRYALITNGSLLTQKLVDEFNDRKVGVALSCDGPLTSKIRDRNVFDDPKVVDLFCQLKDKSIDYTIHAYSQDLYASWEYFDALIPGLKVHHEWLLPGPCMPSDIYDYNFDKWAETCERMTDKVYQEFKTTGTLADSREYNFMLHDMKRMSRFLRGKSNYPVCGACKTHLDIDLHGNLYVCHCGEERYGHIEQGWQTFAPEGAIRIKRREELNKQDCLTCEYLGFCHKGCPIAVPSEAQRIQCRFQKIYYEKLAQMLGKMTADQTTEVEF